MFFQDEGIQWLNIFIFYLISNIAMTVKECDRIFLVLVELICKKWSKLETEFGKSFEMTPTGTLLKGGDGTGGVLNALRIQVEGKLQELVLWDSVNAGQFIPCIVAKGSQAEECAVLTPGGSTI